MRRRGRRRCGSADGGAGDARVRAFDPRRVVGFNDKVIRARAEIVDDIHGEPGVGDGNDFTRRAGVGAVVDAVAAQIRQGAAIGILLGRQP